MNIKKIINWKVYFTLLFASILSIIAILPYVFKLQANIIQTIPIPIYLFAIISVIQGSLLVSVLLFFGLLLAKKIGLGVPFLESYFTGKKIYYLLKPVQDYFVRYRLYLGKDF
jgi:polyferredoxin